MNKQNIKKIVVLLIAATAFFSVTGWLTKERTIQSGALSITTVKQGGTGVAYIPPGDCIVGNGTLAVTFATCGGSGGAGSSATTSIAQIAHGFTVGQWVGLTSSTTAVYALTNAVPGGVYQGVGIVEEITDADHFVLRTSGDFTDTNLIPGMSYYLSASSTAAGTIVGYPATTTGYISAPVAFAKSQTVATINIGRPSIVSLSSSSFGMNVGNDNIGSTYMSTSSMVADEAILAKNLSDKKVRIALPSYNNPVGIYNMREYAKYYKSQGWYVSYGTTGRTGSQSAATYAAWLAQITTQAAWASSNNIDVFYIGNEECLSAQSGGYGAVTYTDCINDVRTYSSTVKSSYPALRVVYSDGEGMVAQWGAVYPDFGALDGLGFNMYNTLSGFDAGVAYFQSQIGAKFFVTEWGANHPYLDMIQNYGYTDAMYASDLAQRQLILAKRGVEAYFFTLRFSDNTLNVNNWNILLNTGVFLPGASAAFGGGSGNAVRPTPLILIDNQKLYFNTVKTAYIDADSTDFRFVAPEFGSFKITLGSRTISFTTATTTFSTTRGINLANGGCYAIAGTCITSSGSGGGGYGVGTFSTTTSNVSGTLNNYPNNTTDIVTIGSNSTTTAEMYFDPNTNVSYFQGSITVGTTTSSLATSTIANLGGVLYVPAFQDAGEDISKAANDAYAFCPLKSCIMDIPRGNFSYATPILFATDGKRALLRGTPAGGTTLTYTGTATSTTINWGIQDTGIDHTSGCGIENIVFKNTDSGSSRATSSSPIIGIEVGGTNGSDCTELTNVDIMGFGYNLWLSANNYNFNFQNGMIRNGGQAIHAAPASNSGELITFNDAFIVDNWATYGAEADNCIYLDHSSVASILFNGVSMDDCAMWVGQANNVTIIGGHNENVGFSSWGKYTPITIDNNVATNVSITGTTFFNMATTLGNSPDQFISNGGTLNLNGVIFRRFGGVTIPTAITLTGSGRVTWQSLNNVSSAAFTEIVTGYGNALSGSTGLMNISALNVVGGIAGVGTTTPVANLQVTTASANATTSLQFGKPSQNKGTCITFYDTGGTPLYGYIAAGATAFTYTSTKPSGCQN